MLGRIVAAGALASALVLAMGCAEQGPRWVKPGATEAQLANDQDDCMTKATVYGDPGTGDPNALARVEADFQDCMHARGWRRPKPQSSP